MQKPPIEENTLRLIGSFARRGPDTSPEALLWADTMKLASDVRKDAIQLTQEKMAKLEAAFRKRISDETCRLGETTVDDVIKGWFANADRYAKNEDMIWRVIQRTLIMTPFLEGLKYLSFPYEDILRLSESADYVAKRRRPERDTSHDVGL